MKEIQDNQIISWFINATVHKINVIDNIAVVIYTPTSFVSLVYAVPIALQQKMNSLIKHKWMKQYQVTTLMAAYVKT